MRKINWFAVMGPMLITAMVLSACGGASAQPSSATPQSTTASTEAPQATETTPMATPETMGTPSASSGVLAAPGATVQTAVNATLGNILTDSQGMTLYTFKNDTPGVSNCTGTCAQNWPPLTVTAGQQPVAGAGVSGQLGVIQRSDGTSQVTYDNMPLYRFIGDKQPGDAKGQGLLNGAWSVALANAAAAPAAPAESTPMAPAATPQATPSSY